MIVADVIYDGTQFILQNPATFAPDADLTAIAALAHTNGHSIYSDGSAWSAGFLDGAAPNIARNPHMRFDQRAGSYTGLDGSAQVYTVDGWWWTWGAPGQAVRWTASRETSGGVSGGDSWVKMDCTTADSTPGSTDYSMLLQKLEAQQCRTLMDGNGIAQLTVSLDIIAFAHASSAITFPATLSIGLRSRDGTQRTVAKKVTITSSATWERVSATFDADATAQIDNDNAEGLHVWVGLDAGSGGAVGAEGTWENSSANYFVGDQDMWGDFAGNYVGWTNVDIHRGPPRPFVGLSYEADLAACQRYYEVYTMISNEHATYGAGASTTTTKAIFKYQVEKRTAPTITDSDAGDFSAIVAGGGAYELSALTFDKMSTTRCRLNGVHSAIGASGYAQAIASDAAVGTLTFDADL